jgi:hypothetical protein
MALNTTHRGAETPRNLGIYLSASVPRCVVIVKPSEFTVDRTARSSALGTRLATSSPAIASH